MDKILSPYEQCPVITGNAFELCLVSMGDAADLLICYSDPQARQLFNSDNCTNTFAYSTIDEMKHAIAFWLEEYKRRHYVRFSIIERKTGHAIGTIEMFTRPAKEGTISIGILRIDLQSDFEKETVLDELIGAAEAAFPNYFAYTALITKVIKIAESRKKVLQNHGFTPLLDSGIMNFDDYYIKYY